MAVVINVHTKDSECYCHVASTPDKGVEWIKNYGGGAWNDEPFAFLMQEIIIDKDEFCEPFEKCRYFDYKGNELKGLYEFYKAVGIK